MKLGSLVRLVRAHGEAALALAWPPECPRCGSRAERARSQFCEACWARLRALRDAEAPGLAAAFAVDSLFLEILGAGKYRGVRSVVERLAEEAAERLEGRVAGGTLVPVPLTAARRRERGFNQSEIFARALARGDGRDVRPEWLRRVRAGAPLAGRPRAERAAAIAGVFRAAPGFPGPAAPPLVLVDDVYTTGSTLGDCTRALEAAGGRVAGFAALGRAFASRDRNSADAPAPFGRS